MRNISHEELLEVIGKEKIEHALKERLGKLQESAASEFALLQAPADDHTDKNRLGPGFVCICQNCCQERLEMYLKQIQQTKQRLDSSSEALVSDAIKVEGAAQEG